MYYSWSIPDAYSKILLVEPKRGVLRGNERHTLYWHFAPKKSGTYSIKVPVTIQRAQVCSVYSLYLHKSTNADTGMRAQVRDLQDNDESSTAAFEESFQVLSSLALLVQQYKY